MSPQKTRYSAIYLLVEGKSRNGKKGLKKVHLGGHAGFAEAGAAAEIQPEAERGRIIAVLEAAHVHIAASVIGAANRWPVLN